MSVSFSGAGTPGRAANIVFRGCGGGALAAVSAFNMDTVSVLYEYAGILDKVVFISERLHDDET